MIIKVHKYNQPAQGPKQAQALSSISSARVVKKGSAQPIAVAAEVKPSIFNRIINARPLSADAARQSWNQLFAQEVAA